jgi:hypothetical protein
MNDKSPCYGDGNGCPRRTAICHAQCAEYHAWVAKQRERPKRPPRGEVEADGVLATRKRRSESLRQARYKERRRNGG